MGHPSVGGKIILQSVLEVFRVNMWTGSKWLELASKYPIVGVREDGSDP
jgi:hypothetical protein